MGNEANGAEKDKGGEEQEGQRDRGSDRARKRSEWMDGGSRVKARLWQNTNRRINHPATH